MDSQVEDVKSRLNIADVVGSYLRLTKAGTHWKANCPFHNEKTPSFMVNEERQIWHCFGCGKGGDVFSFVEEIEGVGFREALETLAERAGVDLKPLRRDTALGGQTETPDRSREILELSTKFFEKQLWDGEGKKSVLPYLRKRGLTDESIRTFRLGFAPEGWRHLSDFLTSRDYRPDELEKAGLVIRKTSDIPESYKLKANSSYYDRFRNRIMFPIMDVMGRVIGYSARVAPGSDDTQAKYINTPETPLYRKSRALYGISQAKSAMKETGNAILVEGNMDVIAMHQSGARHCVAVSGTALTPEHLDILGRYVREIRLFFDMDDAGQKAAWKSALLAYGKEMQVSILSLPEGKDAAEAAVEHPEMLLSAIDRPKPAAEYFLSALVVGGDPSNPEAKRRIVEEYAPLLLSMRNPIDRAHWMRELASSIGVEEKLVSAVVESDRSRSERNISGGAGASASKPTDRNVFTKRSEPLRERVIGIIALRPETKALFLADERLAAFLSRHPFFAGIARGDDLLSVDDTEAGKTLASRILFEAEEALSLLDDSRSDIGEEVGRIVSDLREELIREERTELARRMEEARREGDRETERTLAEEFRKLGEGEPNKGQD